MALADRPRLASMVESIEEFTGVAIRPFDQVQRWQNVEQEYVALAGEAEDLALHSMDYFNGRPSEMAPERRKRIAQKSRIAIKFDPLAGAEAQLLADFAFSKGVPTPTARNKKVQEVIDEAWTDANNQEKLTSFAAQRRVSNELLTSGELFITEYEGGGRVRIGRLDPDTVDAVVPDPEDRLRPLWYMVRERRFEWDFDRDAPKFEDMVLRDGKPKVKYWKHWRNYDDAVEEREKGLVDEDESPLETPAEGKMAKGVIYHVAINQTGEELRGNPPWSKSLRFFEAMNVLVEAHVVQAQAASTFIAKRVMKGSPKQVAKAASNVMSHLGELGASRFDPDASRGAMSDRPARFAPGAGAPAPPGSWWNENESSTLEGLKLDSGAAGMAQTGQIVRAPIAAAAGFGQHYLGDASDANLATASTLELPATMRVLAWQQHFEDLLRWFTDRAIEAAVKAGRLGGLDDFPEDGPVSEMRLHEAEDRAAMEKRTGLDLSYEFVMPFPGRRQLEEVSQWVSTISQSMDPNGVNIPLRKHLLRFAFEQMGIDDVGHAVEESLPEEGLPGGIGPQEDQPQVDPATGEPIPGGQPFQQPTPPSPGGGGSDTGPGGDQPKNVKKGTTVGGKPTAVGEAEWIPAELRRDFDDFATETDAMFSKIVGSPATLAALELAAAGSSNGTG